MAADRNAEMVSFVNDLVDQELQRNFRWHGDIFTNLAYLSGNQFVRFSKETGMVLPIPYSEEWQVRIVLNKTMDVVSRVTAQTLRNRPQWVCMPGSGTLADYIASLSWQKYFDYVWQHHMLRRVLRDEVIPWSLAAGRGILRTRWNANAGETWRIRVPRDPKGVAAPAGTRVDEQALAEAMFALGQQPPEPQQAPGLPLEQPLAAAPPAEDEFEVTIGELDFASVCPLNWGMDRAATHISRAAYAWEVGFARLQDVEELYGKRFQPDAEEGTNLRYSRKVLGAVQRWGVMLSDALMGRAKSGRYVKGVGLYGSEGGAQSLVLVKELYTRPSKRNPEGQHIVVIGDQLADAGKNPYAPYLPYVTFDYAPILGSGDSDSLISQLRPPQSALNRLVSAKMQLVNLFGKPRVLNPTTCGVDKDQYNDKPGGIIDYRIGQQGEKPEIQSPPNLGSFWGEDIAFYLQMMEEIGGVRKVSQGVNPEGVRSAAALVHLKEADDEGRATFLERTEDALTDEARLIAHITRAYQIEDRVLPLRGRDGEASILEFRRTDIELGVEVQVHCEPGLPKTFGGKVSVIQQILGMGLLDTANPDVRRRVLRAILTGDLQSILDSGDSNELERILLENIEMLQGVDAQVRPQDKHGLHAEEHSEFMRTPAYLQLADSDPSLDQRFMMHRELHLMALQGNVMGPGVGAMPGAGGPSQSASPPPAPEGAGQENMLPGASGGPMAAVGGA